ncbi:MAG: hypothetical protein ABJE10_23010 [bacterium]
MPKQSSTPPQTPLHTMPKFGDLQGSYYSLPLKPPFSITNLSCRLFPLRANLNSVQGFVNNYVNVVPEEVGHFRAFSPYLLLMMLDYGSLALEATNLGWFSQHEIMFCVPVEWYRIVKGKWVFHDWAMLTPFIFVDDDLSLNMGRTVAGWPKTYAKMTPTMSAWMRDPIAPVNEATASAMVFSELYAGKKQEERVFLEIDRDAPIANMRVPFNTNSPIAPWMVASNMAKSAADFGRDSLGWMNGLGLMPLHQGSSASNYGSMLRNMATAVNPMRPNMTSNILNCKQFRASEDPSRYCYQALTMGAMKFTKFNGIGLLGEQAVMAGDLSGGYSVKLHEWPSLPITRLLGLEVEKRWKGDGVNVAQLRPVMPYWYDCNMDYQTGYNVAWRTRDGIWRDRDGHRHLPSMIGNAVAPDELLYNSALGPSSKPVAGPFRFAGTTIRVLPLLATRATVEKYLEEYLNEPLASAKERFTLWCPDDPSEMHAHVYLTATSFGDVTSGTNNVGDWADREMAFLIPVKREREVGKDKWELVGVGLVPAYTYVDNVTAAISGSEVLGIPTTGARFGEAESSWMSEEGPAPGAAQTLLLVDAEILPAVGEGERTQKRRIVEIMQGTPVEATDPVAWRVTGDRWSAILRQELDRKYATKDRFPEELQHARAMGLALLGNRVPISMFTMKQFRDNADPDFACYQSIVRIQRTLMEVLDFREIEQPLVIRMHDFPTQPIVAQLGLIGKPIRDDGVGVAYALQPIRPFWIRVAKEEDLGQPLVYRAGTPSWSRAGMNPSSYFDDYATTTLRSSTGVIQDQGDPRRLETTVDDGQTGTGGKNDLEVISLGEARSAVERIDPQMVIESILSREWGNWDDNARWREGRRELETLYASAVAGVPPHKLAFAEQQFFVMLSEKIRSSGIEKSIVSAIDSMRDNLWTLNESRTPMEEQWAILTDWGVERLYPTVDANDTQHAPATNGEIVGAIKNFLDDVLNIGLMPVKGEPASLNGRKDFAVRDNGARMREIFAIALEKIRAELRELIGSPQFKADQHAAFNSAPLTDPGAAADPYRTAVEKAWAVWPLLREAVTLARARCDLQREALLSQLSKTWQKPEFCVRRDSAGPEKERLFPRAESWDNEWYVGAMHSMSAPMRSDPPDPDAAKSSARKRAADAARKPKRKAR